MIIEQSLTHLRDGQDEAAEIPATTGPRSLEIEWMDVEWTESDWLHIWLRLARTAQETQANSNSRSPQVSPLGDWQATLIPGTRE